jgi:hypothetical protein
MNRQIASIGIVIGLAWPATAGGNAPPGPSCRVSGPLVSVAELPEGRGIAPSRRSPDRFWTHNDSGEPMLMALDAKGAVVGRVRVSGAGVEDWEAQGEGIAFADDGTIFLVGEGGNKSQPGTFVRLACTF